MWKSIENTNYQVSNNGVVVNAKTGRTLKQDTTSQGYKRVVLCIYGKPKHYAVHRLVAEAFIPNPEGKPFIDHYNDNPGDNRVDNLRWVSSYENNTKEHHRVALSKANTGKVYSDERKAQMRETTRSFNWIRKDNPNAKQVIELNLQTGEETVWDCLTDAAEHYGISVAAITQRIKRHSIVGGVEWRYAC